MPVRGNPSTKIGLRMGCCATSGWSVSQRWRWSRLRMAMVNDWRMMTRASEVMPSARSRVAQIRRKGAMNDRSPTSSRPVWRRAVARMESGSRAPNSRPRRSPAHAKALTSLTGSLYSRRVTVGGVSTDMRFM